MVMFGWSSLRFPVDLMRAILIRPCLPFARHVEGGYAAEATVWLVSRTQAVIPLAPFSAHGGDLVLLTGSG